MYEASTELDARILDDEDALSVLASFLQISEFQLFHVAYSFWYGRKITDKSMEHYFADYMFFNAVPFWVRALLRKTSDDLQAGELNVSDLDIKPVSPAPPVWWTDYGYVTALSLFMAILVKFFCGTPGA